MLNIRLRTVSCALMARPGGCATLMCIRSDPAKCLFLLLQIAAYKVNSSG